MNPNEILASVLKDALENPKKQDVTNQSIRQRMTYVAQIISNRAGIRLLLSCLLAKVHKPAVDARKPYTEIGSDDSFSGRTYDEQYLTHFINENQLPCNTTTAFLTPALRNIDRPLTTDVNLVGRPREVYQYTLQLLDDVQSGKASALAMLTDSIRLLIELRESNKKRMEQLISELEQGRGALPLSSEQILTLISQHLASKNSSRLPVLIVAAAYKAAGTLIGEQANILRSHNAADLQTKALGDVEVFFVGDDSIVTAYEMKNKLVTKDDIDSALKKLPKKPRLHNYVFITTEPIDAITAEYAASFYERTGGTEFVILDCLGFLKHFIHFFHRHRVQFIDEYQQLVLSEPDSAVSQPLKEAFLALRRVAEADE